MMRKYKCCLLLMALPYWMPMAVAGSAASGVAASAAVIPSPEEDYQAGIEADNRGEMLEAGRLYLRAAERGHAAAQAEVAIGLRNASMNKGAFELFRKSAEQGNTAGMRGLATMYAESGVAVTQNFTEARKWYTKAADMGDAKAINVMAETYIKGGLGLSEAERNSPDALSWIKRSADINYPPAMLALADAYRAGKLGLAADPNQADEWDAKRSKVLGIVEKKKKKERIFK